MIKRTAILIVLFLSIFLKSYATDSIRLQIKVDAITVIGEQIRMQYIINADCKEIQLSEKMKDFNVLTGPMISHSTTTSVINGVSKTRNETMFTYLLIPVNEGTSYIPGASVNLDGKIYSCSGLDIKILPQKVTGKKSLSSIKDSSLLFIKQEVSPKRIIEGEPVKISYKLYTQKDITRVHDIKFPAFDGCWIDEIKGDSVISFKKEEYDNAIYNTLILKEYTLYPLRSGDFVIDGFSLDFEYRKKTDRKENSFFGEIDIFENIRDTLYVDSDTMHVRISPDNNLKGFKDNHAISPESSRKVVKRKSDIVLAIDISGSMLAEDFNPNRQGATKNVIKLFRNKLPKIKTGFVLFAGKSYPQTANIKSLSSNPDYKKLVPENAFEDGTAIGMGLISSLNLLADSENSPKAILLLTDGTNNMGNISPITAAEIARQKRISIFIIGMGGIGKVPYPYLTPSGDTQFMDMETKIDEKTLEKMALITGGRYFRVTDDKSFSNVANDIIELLSEIKQPGTKGIDYISPENTEYILDLLK
ncbi:MAG: VWA domain-containing protein [Dysgonomonas sp.]